MIDGFGIDVNFVILYIAYHTRILHSLICKRFTEKQLSTSKISMRAAQHGSGRREKRVIYSSQHFSQLLSQLALHPYCH